MKRAVKQFSILSIGIALMVPVTLLAQNSETNKEKTAKDSSVTEMITITRKGDKNEKTTIEINGENVTVNGKPIGDLKGGDITVRRNIIRKNSGNGNGRTRVEDVLKFYDEMDNKAMLGVTTEKTEQGVAIRDVSDGSAAEKAGLKEKDVITKVDDQKVTDPDDLSKEIGKHKPGDKVKITFLRDGKEQIVTAELTKWKGINLNVYNRNGNGYNYDFKMPDMKSLDLPDIQSIIPRDLGRNWDRNFRIVSGRPMIGLSVQDTEDGKGVKVINVDGNGSADKAGIKENDLITEIDGKVMNSADAVAKTVGDSKDKNSLMFKVLRNGKTMNIEVKIPRKLKTADL